jgi:hypothetical protein
MDEDKLRPVLHEIRNCIRTLTENQDKIFKLLSTLGIKSPIESHGEKSQNLLKQLEEKLKRL